MPDFWRDFLRNRETPPAAKAMAPPTPSEVPPQLYKVGHGVSAPRVISAPDPTYAEAARAAKYQGTVVLWLVLGADGAPKIIRIARPVGLGLDEKAVNAIKQWKFEPAKLNDQPVPVQINVEVNFRLY